MHRKGAAAHSFPSESGSSPRCMYGKHRNGCNSAANDQSKASGNETLLSELASTAVASAYCKPLKSVSGFPWPRTLSLSFPERGSAPHLSSLLP
jgi:hypothetical protein